MICLKVIGFVSSPRKDGNTSKLVKSALDGAKKAGAETKLFQLSEMDIGDCKACMFCKANDGCAQKDDFQEIYKEICDADGIVFGSPIYFFDINAKARLVEDRLFAFTNAEMKSKLPKGKKAILLTSQTTPDKNAFMNNLKVHETSMNMLGIEPVGILTTFSEMKDDSPEIEEAKKLGEKIAE